MMQGHVRPRRPRIIGWALLGLLVSSLAPVLTEAQYFGRNKVIWEQFDFRVLETAHFRIHYYPPDAQTADYIARIAERWYERLSMFFDHEFTEKKLLIVYQDHADFQQTVVTPGLIGEGTGGFTESRQDRIVLPLTGINEDNNHVIGHELVHAFQFDLEGPKTDSDTDGDGDRRGGGDDARRASAQRLPLWMVEGLAEYLSQGRRDPATALHMRDAVLHERLPDHDAFLTRRLSPYQYGQAIWAFIAGRWSDETARDLFVESMVAGFDAAIEAVLDVESVDFWPEFHASLRDAYGPILEQREEPAAGARPFLNSERTGGAVNLAPSLSPDGEQVAFLSTRELALELFLADAETGEVQRKLVSAEADPHFDNLSFLDSSAAWSPDGSRLAFSVFARGERRLAIYDVERAEVERRLDLPAIKGMRHASWSPDGRTLVFSAIVRGASDLYSIDLETNELSRLTDDAYSAIQPAFAPDGQHIVFVTDRGQATDLETLSFGPMQLALLDLESGRIETLEIFARGKHVDPHFAPDGESIYFIGEPDGVSDVYRYDLTDGRVARVTRLNTGVTGITATSPALSVATGTGAVAFSVLEDGDWNIYRREPGPSVEVSVADIGEPQAGTLPPFDAQPGPVEAYLMRPELGLLSAEREFPVRDYDSGLRFTRFGPASIGIGTDSRGTGVGGALSAYFNDPLNRHQLATTLMGGSTQGGALDFEDSLGADVTYLNQTRRFRWGAQASRVPYLRSARFFAQGRVDVDGTIVPANVAEQLFEIVTVTEASMFGQYPLSLNNRIELTAGVSNIDYERELERVVFPQDAAPFRDVIGLPSPEALDLQSGGIAFVRDTSEFGLVSPVRGTRIRAEMEWTTGDLDYRTTQIDYRRYLFHRPFTFAFRALHLGRHGEDANDPRLLPLDIGRSTLVRGYEVGSFDFSECTLDPMAQFQGCPEIDRLFGSRIGVLNFEMRLPLIGSEDFGLFDFPAAPTELIFFVDVGAAWSSGESVELEFERDTTKRVPVVSAGIAARTVVLGSLPIEFYYAYPYQRPEEGATFGVSFNVGW
jgi:WD40 repeat protein